MAKLLGSSQRDALNIRRLADENSLLKNQLEAAVSEATRVQLALDNHIQSRTNLILTVKDILEKFTTDKGNMITDYWSERKALFIGFKKDNQYHGILNSQNRLKDHLDHISIGTWDSNKVMIGFGIKLQRNKVAYYG